MTEPLTLAQRLRDYARRWTVGDNYSENRARDCDYAADELDRLCDANKALTEERDEWRAASDRVWGKMAEADNRATAAEAKLAKVEAELEEHKVMLFDAYGGDVTATALFQQRLDERLSAELAEARRVIVKSDEDLRSIHLHIEEHSFPRANGIISQALFRIRSFLASKGASHE